MRRARISSRIEKVVFGGVLSARRKKDDLKAMAHILGLPLEGTNDHLAGEIKKRLKEQSEWREDDRLCQLYPAIDREFPPSESVPTPFVDFPSTAAQLAEFEQGSSRSGGSVDKENVPPVQHQDTASSHFIPGSPLSPFNAVSDYPPLPIEGLSLYNAQNITYAHNQNCFG